MNIADIIAEYGAYYLGNQGEGNRQRIKTLLFVSEHFGKLFTMQPTKATRWQGAIASIGQVVQQYQQGYTPLSNAELKPKFIDLEHIKIDLEENPSNLEESWAGFLTRLAFDNGKSFHQNRLDWPFIRWYLEELVIPKYKEQMEMSEYFWGIKGVVIPGTPTDEGASLTGINKKIDDDAAAVTPLMNHISAGAYPTTPTAFVQFMEDLTRQFLTDNPKLRRMNIEIMLNSSLELLYRSGYRELYGKDTDHTSMDVRNRKIIDTNISLVGCTAMDNDPFNPGIASKKILMTYPENRVRPITFNNSGEMFMVQSAGSNPRAAWMWTDWHEAVDFALPQHVTVITE